MLGGRVEGNADTTVHGLSKIEEGTEGTLTFLANPKYAQHIYTTGASLAIVGEDFVAEQALPKSLSLIRVADVYSCFAKLLEAYNQLTKPKPGISTLAAISSSAKIGNNAYVGDLACIGSNVAIGDNVQIYPGVYIGDNCSVGNNTVLYPGVKIYAGCVIGNNCNIHAGVIIGGDGFGFAPNQENNYSKVPQIGNVIVEDHVEIGSNSTIDRATLGSTIIRKGVKLDNLIQIAHNVEIGENTVIAAQTGIAGSTHIGKNCLIGGQVGIIGHLHIADGTKIAAQSGIGHDIKEPNTIVQGSPGFAIMDYKKSYVGFRKLPELMSRLSELEKLVKELSSRA